MTNLSPLRKSAVHALSGQRIADPPPVEEWSMALGAWERIHPDARNRECQQPKAAYDWQDNIGANQRSEWVADESDARQICQ